MSTPEVALYLRPESRPLLLSSCAGQPGPEAALRLARVVEEVYAQTSDDAHAVDACDLWVLGGKPDHAVKLLGGILAMRRDPPNELRVRLAGYRLALHLGNDYAAFLIDLGARILPVARQRAALARAGAFLRLNVLSDALVLNPPDLVGMLGAPKRLVQLLGVVLGPLLVDGPLLGTHLRSLVDGNAAPGVEQQIMFKRVLLGRAMGADPPPRGAEPASTWAQTLLTRAGTPLDDASPRVVHHMLPVLHIDQGLEEIDRLVQRAPRDASSLAARANVRLQKVLALLSTNDNRAAASEVKRVLEDADLALRLQPDNLAATMIFGWFEADIEGNAAAAIARYDRVLALSPFDPLALRYRGVNRMRAGDDGGEDDVQLAERLLPRHPVPV